MTTINNTPNRAARRRGRRAVAATVLCASMAAGATVVRYECSGRPQR